MISVLFLSLFLAVAIWATVELRRLRQGVNDSNIVATVVARRLIDPPNDIKAVDSDNQDLPDLKATVSVMSTERLREIEKEEDNRNAVSEMRSGG